MYLLWFAPPAMIALLGPLGAAVAVPATAADQAEDHVLAQTRFAPV
jgi:hypothetical protein